MNLKMDVANQELLCTADILHEKAEFDEKNGEHNMLVEKVTLDMGIAQFADGKEDTIYDIIEARKRKFSPIYEAALEATIFRIVDKLNKFIKKPKKAKASCKDSDCEISKYFATREIALPRMFTDTFEEIMASLKKKF